MMFVFSYGLWMGESARGEREDIQRTVAGDIVVGGRIG